MLRTTLSVLAVLTLSIPSWAETEAEKGNTDLAAAVKQLNAACGSSIVVAYDWPSERASPGKPGWQGPLYCKSIVEGVAAVCADALAKGVVKDNIQGIGCRFEQGAAKKTEYGGPLLAHAGKKLEAVYDWTSANLDSDTSKWLTKKWTIPAENGPVTIEARKERKRGEDDFPAAIERLQTRCGVKVPVTYDWSSEKGNDAKPAWQGYYFCRDALEGLGNGCEYDGAKAAFAKKVTAITCKFVKDASKRKDLHREYGGAAHDLKGKALTISYDWTSANLDSAARVWAAALK